MAEDDKRLKSFRDEKKRHREKRDPEYDKYITRVSRNAVPEKEVKEDAARWTADARAKASIHTDTVVGALVELMQGSVADILPEHPILQRARANGVDRLIKKLTITPVRIGTRSRKNANGSVTEAPVIREKIELETYSRLDAIQQLRDNFGMKQEPRSNSFEETKRQEIERAIEGIMVAEGCDETTAAETLLANIGDAPHLVTVIRKYIKKHKPKEASGIN